MSPTSSTSYPRGSEWRKWDPHVHSPSSYTHDFSFSDESERIKYAGDIWTKYLEKLGDLTDIAAVGITDYFSIEGYRRIWELRHPATGQNRLPNIPLVLANIELRLDVVVDGKRLDYHVLFSEEIEPETIETAFLGRLKVRALGSEYPLNRASLTEIGRAIKREQPGLSSLDDYAAGCTNATVRLDEVRQVLGDGPRFFRGKYLLVLPTADWDRINWDSQAHLTRKNLYIDSDCLFAANPRTILWALGHLQGQDEQQFLREFRRAKPCLHGSDAHGFDKLCKPDLERFCWIRADPTFDGLRQVCNEPYDRIYIGKEPPLLERVRTNPRWFISSVDIRKKRGGTTTETWFDDLHVELNPGMVAIIGNKGSGKSALADIIGVLGDTHVDPQSFAFLHKDRFRKQNKAGQFEARLHWTDEQPGAPSQWRSLDLEVVPSAAERLRYIPQKYFEALCNELDDTLEQQIEKVIYDALPPSERGGADSLTALVKLKRDPLDHATEAYKARLRLMNARIAEMERKGSKASVEKLRSAILERKRLVASMPAPVPRDPPAGKPDKEVMDKLEVLRTRSDSMGRRIADMGLKQTTLIARRSALQAAASRIATLQEDLTALRDDIRGALAKVGIDVNQILADFNVERIAQAETRLTRAIDGFKRHLDPHASDGLPQKMNAARKEAEELQSKMDEPNRLYQAYLKEKADWEQRKMKIEGDPANPAPDTVRFLERSLEYDETQLPTEIVRARSERLALARQIHIKKVAVLNVMRELYQGVQSQIAGNPLLADRYPVSIDAALRLQGFTDGFLECINKQRLGSFKGAVEGRTQLEHILSGVDFGNTDSVAEMLRGIIHALEANLQDTGADKSPPSIDSQVKGEKAEVLYDYLFSMDYLRPEFRLTLKGRGLSELSPGEKGYMLLVFYLYLDRDNTPLVIDQPEENLDNQSVFELMLPCLREAKQRRQLIIVTHNPNLAVVCDADQVIRARIDKTAGNTVSYSAGAIENPRTNADIVEVLEGTMPAFDNRDVKYDTSRLPRDKGEATRGSAN